jgi:transposase
MTLEPLADYLQPRFGNIYTDNLSADDGFVGYRPWTPELEQAVGHYLIHEATDQDYARFLDEVDADVSSGSREEQAASVMEQQLPWEIACAFHWAAVNAVSTLDQLLGDAKVWEDIGQRDDATVWLDIHATEDQLAELAEYTNHPERDPATPWYEPQPRGEHFTRQLTPSQLRDAWHHFDGPSASDFTDDEWELLASHFPPRKVAHGHIVDRNAHELTQRRRSYDGIRYRFSNEVPWSRLPRRYGGQGSVYQRFVLDKKNGVFAHLAQSLKGVPEAAGLVEWLKQLAANRHSPANSTGQTDEADT